MKTYWKISWMGMVAAMFISISLTAQEPEAAETGLPGDHFSLEGAIELFKNAKSVEDFEKQLNAEDSNINNLDLNEDGEIDYVRVIDNMDGDVHAIVLQVAVSETESQDIAVIEIEKQGDENAILQIIGDEDIYGEQVIVEPFDDEAKDNGKGPSVTIERVVVNVWLWPSVRFVYHPSYVVWVSPWHWRHYPVWWKPWRPHPWNVFHVRVTPYHRHCHVVTTHRVVHAHKVYTPRRSSSTVVHTRTTTKVAARGPGGRKAGVSKTTTTTTVKGKKGGSVTKKNTTTKAGVKGRNGGAAGAKKSKTTVKKKRGG